METDKIKLDKAVQPFLSLPSCTKCTSIGFDAIITIHYIPIIFAGWIPYGPPTLRRDATIHPLCSLRGQVRCIETDTQDIEICVLLLGGPN